NEYVRSFFRNVDVSQVFSAGDIARKAQVTVIERPGASVRTALARLQDHDRDVAVVHDRQGRYQGVVTTDSLARVIRRLGRDDQGNIEQAFVTDVEAVAAETPLAEVMTRVAQSRWPVPVVRHDDGRYLGAITKTALLQ